MRRNGRKVVTLGPASTSESSPSSTGDRRTATVLAETPMELLVLGQREFAGMLDEVPHLAHKLLTIMASRVREADTRAPSH